MFIPNYSRDVLLEDIERLANTPPVRLKAPGVRVQSSQPAQRLPVNGAQTDTLAKEPLPLPPQPRPLPPQPLAPRRQSLAVPQQSLAFPQQSLAVPQQSLAFPQQSLAVPQQSLAFPQQSLAFPQPRPLCIPEWIVAGCSATLCAHFTTFYMADDLVVSDALTFDKDESKLQLESYNKLRPINKAHAKKQSRAFEHLNSKTRRNNFPPGNLKSLDPNFGFLQNYGISTVVQFAMSGGGHNDYLRWCKKCLELQTVGSFKSKQRLTQPPQSKCPAGVTGKMQRAYKLLNKEIFPEREERDKKREARQLHSRNVEEVILAARRGLSNMVENNLPDAAYQKYASLVRNNDGRLKDKIMDSIQSYNIQKEIETIEASYMNFLETWKQNPWKQVVMKFIAGCSESNVLLPKTMPLIHSNRALTNLVGLLCSADPKLFDPEKSTEDFFGKESKERFLAASKELPDNQKFHLAYPKKNGEMFKTNISKPGASRRMELECFDVWLQHQASSKSKFKKGTWARAKHTFSERIYRVFCAIFAIISRNAFCVESGQSGLRRLWLKTEALDNDDVFEIAYLLYDNQKLILNTEASNALYQQVVVDKQKATKRFSFQLRVGEDREEVPAPVRAWGVTDVTMKRLKKKIERKLVAMPALSDYRDKIDKGVGRLMNKDFVTGNIVDVDLDYKLSNFGFEDGVSLYIQLD